MKHEDSLTSNGTLGGMFASVFAVITFENIVETSLLAAVAATVSYLVSRLIKCVAALLRRWK
jgi:hypothetical protein